MSPNFLTFLGVWNTLISNPLLSVKNCYGLQKSFISLEKGRLFLLMYIAHNPFIYESGHEKCLT